MVSAMNCYNTVLAMDFYDTGLDSNPFQKQFFSIFLRIKPTLYSVGQKQIALVIAT